MPVKKKRASRRNPVKRGSRPVMTPRDLRIFDYLLTQKFSSADDLEAMIGGEHTRFQERLRHLTSWGFLIRPPAQHKTIIGLRNPCIYQIGPEALELLKERGDNRKAPTTHPLFFGHDVIASRVLASFVVGAQRSGAQFVSWEDMQAGLPEDTITASKPWLIPDVPYRLDGERETKDVEADTKPFGISTMAEDRQRTRYVRGIEADGNTEPWRRREGTNLLEKFLADLSITETKLYKDRWNINNCYMPYVFSRFERMQQVMKEFEKLTKGYGSRFILFGHFPRFDDDVPWPKPTGHMLKGWKRVGGPDFSFLDP